MAARVSKTDVLNRLEMRFDYQSARNVLNNWRKSTGSREEGDLEANDVASLADYLEEEHENVADVAAALRRVGGGNSRGGGAAKPAPEPEPVKAEAAKPAPVEAAPEAEEAEAASGKSSKKDDDEKGGGKKEEDRGGRKDDDRGKKGKSK